MLESWLIDMGTIYICTCMTHMACIHTYTQKYIHTHTQKYTYILTYVHKHKNCIHKYIYIELLD